MPYDTVVVTDFADLECEASAKSVAVCATREQQQTFLFANTFLSSMEKQTLIIGMRNLFTSQDYVWGRMMVASLLTAIPVIIVFSLVERFISGGRMDGGVKG